MNATRRISLWLVTCAGALLVSAGVYAGSPGGVPESNPLGEVDIEQKLDTQVDDELQFQNSRGESVQIGDYFDGRRPVVLALGYVQCPNLCSLVHESMIDGLEELPMRMGEDYRVISASIDPDEPLDLTRSARERYLQMYDGEGASSGWHSLVGTEESIRRLAEQVGFQYAYDEESGEYAHPGMLVILTPEGRISRYFFGVDFPPDALRLGLLDASEGSIGSPVDQVLMRCFHYDPKNGTYSLAIMRLVRVAGGVMVVVMVLGLWILSGRSKRREEG